MAVLYPFSGDTAERLKEMPSPGNTHRWMAQIAGGLQKALTSEQCFAFLRRCCDDFVAHRAVPDREIEEAVALAYAGKAGSTTNFGRGSLHWPGPNSDLIRKTLTEVEPCFDGVTSTGLRPADVLPQMFAQGELVCTGKVSELASVRPLDAALQDAEFLQFIVVNPMERAWALNHRGERSVRCQNNVGHRRHIVAEFDDTTLTKQMQAQLATALATFAPFVMAVDSGGKSVHAWYCVEHLSPRDQARFFAVACLLGADSTRWDICGWLRMPAGLRVVDGVPEVRQSILYFNPQVTAEVTSG